MAHMWKVGDKAVCVDARPCKSCGRIILTQGRMYEVLSILVSGQKDRNGFVAGPNYGMSIEVSSADCCNDGSVPHWDIARFRPIVKADDDFIDQMRALKPKVKQ